MFCWAKELHLESTEAQIAQLQASLKVGVVPLHS
jgi:hypothetical protein